MYLMVDETKPFMISSPLSGPMLAVNHGRIYITCSYFVVVVNLLLSSYAVLSGQTARR